MICDLSIVLHVTYEDQLLLFLFLDMRNAALSHFLTACLCRSRYSRQVFATRRTRMEGHDLYVMQFAIVGMC